MDMIYALNMKHSEERERQHRLDLKRADALRKEHEKGEAESKELERKLTEITKRFVKSHLKNGNDDVDSAVDELEALGNKDEWAETLVKLIFHDSKVSLQHLTSFVCKIQNFSTSYIAINALYEKLEDFDRLEEIEVVVLFYKIHYLVEDTSFKLQSAELQQNILGLKQRLEKNKHEVMNSLVDNIKNGEFERPNSVRNQTTQFDDGADKFYFMDLVKLYLKSTSLDEFPHLNDFILSLPTYISQCIAQETIWQELQVSGHNDTMEALVVWMRASEITKARNSSNDQCLEIADSPAPAYEQTLISNYKNFIKNGRILEIIDLHGKYDITYFLANYIYSLSKLEMQNENFNKLIAAINALPHIEDVCIAASAVYEQLENFEMSETFEHFQTLQTVKKMMTDENYKSMTDKFAKSKCESVVAIIPPVFHQLLYGDTSNCRLLNRQYDSEPLFCTSLKSTDEFGYRNIYLSTSKEDAADQFWNLRVSLNVTLGVFLRNNYHKNIDLRFVNDNMRGSNHNLDELLDYFRIQIKDNDYILLEPTSSKFFDPTCRMYVYKMLYYTYLCFL
jgi:hypothetical protein